MALNPAEIRISVSHIMVFVDALLLGVTGNEGRRKGGCYGWCGE